MKVPSSTSPACKARQSLRTGTSGDELNLGRRCFRDCDGLFVAEKSLPGMLETTDSNQLTKRPCGEIVLRVLLDRSSRATV